MSWIMSCIYSITLMNWRAENSFSVDVCDQFRLMGSHFSYIFEVEVYMGNVTVLLCSRMNCCIRYLLLKSE